MSGTPHSAHASSIAAVASFFAPTRFVTYFTSEANVSPPSSASGEEETVETDGTGGTAEVATGAGGTIVVGSTATESSGGGGGGTCGVFGSSTVFGAAGASPFNVRLRRHVPSVFLD